MLSQWHHNNGPPTQARAPKAGAPATTDGRDESARGPAAVCQEGPAKDERAGEQARQAGGQVVAHPVQLEAVPDGMDGGVDCQQDGAPRPYLPLLHPHQSCQPSGILEGSF